MLHIENLHYSYEDSDKKVLEGLSFSLEAGQLVSVLGENGVGKSTLFKCILGIIRRYRGSIRVGEREVKEMHHRQMSEYFSYIPQHVNTALHYSVQDMVLLGLARHIGVFSLPKRKQEELAFAALEKFGVLYLAKKSFLAVSGGERQLVMMARSFCQNSKIWILDEPCSNLDYGNQMRVWESLRKLSREGYLIVLSSHHPEQSYIFSDRILVLHEAKILAQGRPQEVIRSEVISRIYRMDLEVHSLCEDRCRVILPPDIYYSEKMR